MTDRRSTVFDAPLAPRGVRLIRALQGALRARATRRALDKLPDHLLKDVGLSRGDIPFVAGRRRTARSG